MTPDQAIAELRAMSEQLVTAKKPNIFDCMIQAIEDQRLATPHRLEDFSDGELLSETTRRGLTEPIADRYRGRD